MFVVGGRMGCGCLRVLYLGLEHLAGKVVVHGFCFVVGVVMCNLAKFSTEQTGLSFQKIYISFHFGHVAPLHCAKGPCF